MWSSAATLGYLGPFPFTDWGLWGPSLGAIPTLVREYLSETSCSWTSFSSGCQPGIRVVPLVGWPVLGLPPFCTFHHCTGQEATDPQSPKGGSQRAWQLGVPTPRLLGVWKEWRCLSSRPCCRVAVRSRLFGLPAREICLSPLTI